MPRLTSGYIDAYDKPKTGIKKHREHPVTDLIGVVQEISEAGAINTDACHVKITGPATSTFAVTLAAPSRGGQIMVIEMVETTDTNAVTLALTNVAGGSAATTATFNAAAETLTLVSSSSKWVVLDELGVTLA